MKSKFSKSWKASKQPRKQRKYRYNATKNIRNKFIDSHLSKDLKKKYNKRSVRIKKGDKVKIMRGQYKNKAGKIERINVKREKVYIQGVEGVKKDGTKIFVPVHPSNLLVLELEMDDRIRKKIIERK